MNRVNELLDHVKTQMLLADKRRCDAIENREPAQTILYWTGRQSAWIEAADLILHYMKGADGKTASASLYGKNAREDEA